MSVKKFLLSRVFLKNLGIAVLIFLLLSWLSMLALSIYTNKGKVIFTPDFSGMNISQVQNIADQKALRVTVKDSAYRPNVAVGTVLMQNPLAGHKIKPGRMIYITLASALPEKTEVPKVTDVSLRQARVLLESKGSSVGNVEYKPSEFDGLVLEQRYKGQAVTPGTKLDNGSAIDLVVGGRGFGTETTVPNLVGLTFSQAKEQIYTKYLTAGAVIFDGVVQTSQDSMNAIVWKQLPEADSTKQINAGSSVDLWLKVAKKDSINNVQQ
jgi:beta-lactam-binding protein with PASTA domain